MSNSYVGQECSNVGQGAYDSFSTQGNYVWDVHDIVNVITRIKWFQFSTEQNCSER